MKPSPRGFIISPVEGYKEPSTTPAMMPAITRK
jgi:hypothetical protein